MHKLTKVEQALVALEKAKASGRIPTRLQERVNALSDTRGAVSEALSAESAPESVSLARYREQYERWQPRHKAACSWQEVESRILANKQYFLRLAEVMNLGGILFGVDRDGNPLVADGGLGAIMTGMNYADTRKAVMMKETKGKPVPTGYELFPIMGDGEKGDEVLAFEEFTQMPFVRSESGKEWMGSWLDSGVDPECAGYAMIQPGHAQVDIQQDDPEYSVPVLGARRLLRIKIV